MKKVGKILLIVALVFEYVSLALLFAVMTGAANTEVSGLIGLVLIVTIPIVILETIAVINVEKSSNWRIFLIILGALAVANSLMNGRFNISGILLIIGCVLIASDKETI